VKVVAAVLNSYERTIRVSTVVTNGAYHSAYVR